MGSRKTRVRAGVLLLRRPLQWGRDDGVAEDSSRTVNKGLGPPGKLQWGRDDGVAEDRPGDPVGATTQPLLQWGRDDGVAEDAAAPAAEGWRSNRASMGPRRWGRGRRTLVDSQGSPSELQWGRDDGVAEDAAAPAAEGWRSNRASMGPRRWGRGRRTLVDSQGSPSELQWGRDDGVAEDVQGADASQGDAQASMGPRRWGRGRRTRTRRGRLLAMRFNGAATMGSRKTNRFFRGSARPRLASMGPRRWGRGRRSSCSPGRRRHPGFNGAATMGSRKTTAVSSDCSPVCRLQWGRDDGVAEDEVRSVDREGVGVASMGPRRWGRGRPTSSRMRMGLPSGFNGAATMGSRKTSRPRHRRAPGHPSFNGAATMGSRKTRSKAESAGVAYVASMGPRRWGRGRPRAADGGDSPVDASMGPRRWGRGRRRARRTCRDTKRASMGPRRWGRGRRYAST